MAVRLALLIAVDVYQDEALPPSPYAETDALALAGALLPLGFASADQIVLLGGQATRTALASRLRKLVKNPPGGDTLLVFFAGHTFTPSGQIHLGCADTQADDLAETSLPLRTLLDAMRGSAYRRLILLLDTRQGVPLEQIESFFTTHQDAICLVCCQPGEQSHVSGSLKSSIWAHHLIEAFTGKAARARTEEGLLTADTLQAYLEQEVPRTLRATFREAPTQTPRRFGPVQQSPFILADLANLLAQEQAGVDPRLQPLRRGVLRSETTAKVKSLAGFRKFHRLPDRVNANARKFVAELAYEDIKQDVDEIYASIRELLGYKRRDVEGSADRGSGFVRTPDFEYSISVDLAEDDPTTVIWRREVAGIRNPELILGSAFQRIFGSVFDTLVFEFTRPFDLEAWVDRIEEEIPEGVKLRTSSDCSSCDVHVRGKLCVIRLFRDRVEIQGQKTPGSKGLMDAFLHFQDLFSARRDIQALPLLEQA